MLYPLKFEPILKPVIWGGDEICKFKDINPRRDGIGESWELSDVSGDTSIVVNGELKGRSLDDLIRTYGAKLLGTKVLNRFGKTFPLLIKFIDAKEALSIQVHPDDDLAKKRHDSFGKTEMWYVIKAEKEAFLYSGFKEEITSEQYVKSLDDGSFTHYLAKHDVQAGDVFFLPAGRVHAIGAGCFIAEIQQTSNITYRIYDYNRKDKDGNTRQLHTELAKDAIDYKVYPGYKTNYVPGQRAIQPLVASPYFTTNLINARRGEVHHLTSHDSFTIFICIEGKARLTDNQGYSVDIKQGETVLMPAESTLAVIAADIDSKFLQTYIDL